MAVLDNPRVPEFLRVCEEAEGEFEHLPECLLWLADIAELFTVENEPAFQRGDLFLIGGNNTRRFGFDNPRHKFLDLGFRIADVFIEREALDRPTREQLVPDVL
ncbi:MAG: hypothetical protein AAFX08_02880 [Pseudomonadota bacterium]